MTPTRLFTDPSYKPWHARIWQLSAPIMLSNTSTPLLGMVDTAVVGHLDSPHYLGAVALGAMIFSMLFWGFGFLRMGTTGLAAQSRGAGDHDEVRAHLARALMLAMVIGISLILLQTPLSWVAFTLTDSSDAVTAEGRAYFAARIWGAPATLANYCLMGWFLAVNRTSYILALQLTLNGLNIIFDLVFVVGLGMTADGVGYASVIAECCALAIGIILVLRLLKQEPGKLDRFAIFDRLALRRLFVVNADLMIRTLCLQIGFLWFMSQGGRIDDTTLAGNAVLLQFQSFTAFVLDSFAHTAESLAGQAKGERDRRRFDAATVVSSFWALVSSIAFALAYLFTGEGIIYLLTDIEDVRSFAHSFMIYAIVLPLISVASFQLDGIFIGVTETRILRNAMIVSLLVFLAAGYALVPTLGNHGLWIAFTIFMSMRGITLAIAFPKLRQSIPEAV
ncbi:MAG: MATE family efflux transporter [Alphaproteobacteria bacterium]|nr:MATE family efflux transporter [Alphaproteobacteria bacterium SS10]